MTLVPVIVGILGLAVFATLLASLFLKTERSAKSTEGFDEQWFEDFSAFRYLPMRRLLNATDEAFVQRQQLNGAGTLREFRAERRMLFRLYLKDLQSDFGRLSLGAKRAILASAEDQSDQVSSLVGLEWSFRKAVWMAHGQLFLHACGFNPSDATGLIDALQHFEFSIRETYLALDRPTS